MRNPVVKHFISLLFFSCLYISLYAQTLDFKQSTHFYYQELNVSDLIDESPSVIALPKNLEINKYSINKSTVLVKFYATWPKQAPPTSINQDFDFELSIGLHKDVIPSGPTLVSGLSTPTNNSDIRLNINYNQPLSAYMLDFTSDVIQNEYGKDIFLYDNLVLSVNSLIDLKNNYFNGDSGWLELLSTLRLSIEYEIEYGIDAANEPFAPVVERATQEEGRVISLSWNNLGRDFPDYQLQLLKLYNYDHSILNEYQNITTNINWDKALNIFTENAQNTLSLTIGEGTGFYVWRVRPIGTFYDGKEANAKNFGRWSTENEPSIFDAEVVTNLNLNRNQVTNPSISHKHFFFFDDPDKDKNYIYSRTFTEGNRTSEAITFANSLLQTKQTQASIQSQGNTLITQIVPDISGRPALSTLPVPAPNKNLDGVSSFTYQSKFITKPSSNLSNELFTAWDYDQDSNIYTPSQIEDNDVKKFGYYSDNNPDLSIPNAEGYPYSRTIYYNDGTGRIKEQSGVGKTHMVAPIQTDNSGRTIRTLYATPSETELIRLFGDEAPSNESILKTITIDQNNVAQITYTNLSDQTIATAVSFLGERGNLSLSIPSNSFNEFIVLDQVTHNMKTDQGFISSKRLGVLKETEVAIDYVIDCIVLEGLCVNTIIDCGFKLQIDIHNLTDGTHKEIFNSQLSNDCGADGKIKLESPLTETLSPGNYIIEKKLIPNKAPKAQISVAVDRVNEQIKPITNLIMAWYEEMETINDIVEFRDKLLALDNDFENLGSVQLKNKYGFPASFEKEQEHNVNVITTQIAPPDGTEILNAAAVVDVISSCCYISIPVGFVPDIIKPDPEDYTPNDRNGNGIFEPNPFYFIQPENTEFPLDLEGYSLSYLRFAGCQEPEKILYGIPENDIPDPLRRSLRHRIKDSNGDGNRELAIFEGWNVGDINWMVYHMLTDQYNIERGDSTPVIKKQYSFEEIMDCWNGILIKLRDLACGDGNYGEPPFNVSDNVDNADYKVSNNENQSKSNEKEHNDNINDEFRNVGWLLRKLLGITGASKKIRNAQKRNVGGIDAPPALSYPHHPIKEFLDCTGYKFAKILTPNDPCPLPEDADTISYSVGLVGNMGPMRNCSTSGNILRKYSPNPNFRPTNVTQPFFPGVRDPVFAFKYFTYGYEQSGDFEGRIDLKHPDLELLTCFKDPNICEDATGNAVPCCPNEPDQLCDFCGIGNIICEITYEDWSSGQRYMFFETIRNYEKQEIEVDNTFENVDCNQFLNEIHPADDNIDNLNWINYNLLKLKSSCENACETRKGIFKDSLISVLERNCYIIGECKTPSTPEIIPLDDLNLMVEALVSQCKKQCDMRTYKCVDVKQCRPIDKPKKDFHPINDFITYRELDLGVGDLTDLVKDQCVDLAPQGFPNLFRCSSSTPSFTETILRNQAISWLPEIAIQSMCSQPDVSSFNANPNNRTTDISNSDRDRLEARKGRLYDPYQTTANNQIISEAIKIVVERDSN